MATTVKEFLKDRENIINTITAKELEIVEMTETYIDEKIINKCIDTVSNEIKVDLCIAQFKWNPFTNSTTSYSETSRLRMIKELNKRYTDAGWKVKIFIDDSGSMNEADFWILKIK